MTAAGALALLHAWIFWDKLMTGRLVEGGSAIRWISGALLMAGLYWLRRQGVSLWRGRPAMTTWLLVVLLHMWSAGSQPTPGVVLNEPVDTSASTFLLPLTAATLVGLAGLLLAGVRPRRHVPLASSLAPPPSPLVVVRQTLAHAVRIPRAPPVATGAA